MRGGWGVAQMKRSLRILHAKLIQRPKCRHFLLRDGLWRLTSTMTRTRLGRVAVDRAVRRSHGSASLLDTPMYLVPGQL